MSLYIKMSCQLILIEGNGMQIHIKEPQTAGSRAPTEIEFFF